MRLVAVGVGFAFRRLALVRSCKAKSYTAKKEEGGKTRQYTVGYLPNRGVT
ncbi:TPA: hypothetical protein SLG78_003490 [Proteus mirabilis]|nr:hypothetical protein [Proteus mirabilis]